MGGPGSRLPRGCASETWRCRFEVVVTLHAISILWVPNTWENRVLGLADTKLDVLPLLLY